MLYGLLLTVFIILGVFIILFVLVQQSKGSLGIGSMGGETQMLFGGSGGQNFFQKATWIMGGLFMLLSLVLALMKSSVTQTRYLQQARKGAAETAQPIASQPVQEQSTSETSPINE
jgi:preprotein translocase subunit SecG